MWITLWKTLLINFQLKGEWIILSTFYCGLNVKKHKNHVEKSSKIERFPHKQKIPKLIGI